MTTKFKAKKNESMHWLDDAGVMVLFVNGVATLSDKKQIAEMTKHGYVQDFSSVSTTTVKSTIK